MLTPGSLDGVQNNGAQVALIWRGRDGVRRALTYADLAAEAARFANVPRSNGIGAGERVFLISARMPARMHSEYLRGIVLENRITAGRFAVEGRVIALKDIEVPMFVVGTETDHIAPWWSTYKTALFTDCDLIFVLTKGGHNGGILSEPGHRNRHYIIGRRALGAHYIGADAWLAACDRKPGSW